MKERKENEELEKEFDNLSIKSNDYQKILNSIQSITLHQSLYSKALITSIEELQDNLVNQRDELGKVFRRKVFESIETDLETKEYTNNQPKLKSLVSLIDELLDCDPSSLDDENGLNDEMRLMLIYRLSSWYSLEEIEDLWTLDQITRQALKNTIDKLWKVKDDSTQNKKIEIGRLSLSKYIKPIFIETDQNSRVSKQINLRTGRKKPIKSNGFQDELFGPSASIGSQSRYKSNQYLGFWNSIGYIIHQFSSIKEFETIWDLLIPPIFNLLEDYQSNYKLKGLIISSQLIQNVPIILLCRTGIDSVLQNSFNQFYSSLKISESYQIFTITLKNHLNLIQSLYKHSIIDQSTHYNSLNDLFTKSVLTPIHYNQSSNDLQTYIVIIKSLDTFIDLLGIGLLRYHHLFLPYLIKLLTNLKINRLDLIRIKWILNVVDRLLRFDLLAHWKNRFGFVCLASWIEFKEVYQKTEMVKEVDLKEIKRLYSLIIKKCLIKEIDEKKEEKKRIRLMDEILKIDSSLNELFL
ncbi:hypothetical protein DFH28DRAFT_58836 [Melampsora americana]|nr:hypothetical protein DFH28DRAFT_58836 [Melampsora americana]